VKLTWLWLRALVTRRSGRFVGMAAGIAIAVALVASIGSFLNASQATMTMRTVANVAVDWQVEVQPGADPTAVLSTVRSQPGTTAADPVGFATTTGLAATAGGTTQTTGSGVVVGIPSDYAQIFPAEIRPLVGANSGVLIAQQTAANLRVKPGDTVSIARAGLDPVSVTVSGVIDLPQADTLFQKVGAPAGSQPSAPPDNIVLLTDSAWHSFFDQLAMARPDQVTHQVHVRLDHHLPASPAGAFEQVTSAAHNLEARLAGAGLVGNNAGAALDAARSDAAYATVMFLFLGLPGAALAALLVAAVASSGSERRRREQALLRARGANGSMLARIAAAEAVAAGFAGVVAGLAAAFLLGVFAFGSAGFGSDVAGSAAWAAAAALAGLVIAVAVIALPAWRDSRRQTVALARQIDTRSGLPRWVRLGSAAVLIAAAIAIFVVTSQQGYHLVLAPEGVPSITVDYFAFLGPACLWIGAALLTWRLAEVALVRGRRLVARAIAPIAGALARITAASMARQHRVIAPAVVMVAITVAFAASTSIFNSTYAQQAEVDARLSNGADVTVTQAASAAGSFAPGQLQSVTGVQHVEPLLHRFAYVGADLQDLYGVRASTIVAAGSLQDAYFQGGGAAALMSSLGARADAILVSAETVKDYQLQLGDRLMLRLPDHATGQLIAVPFHYVGVVKEFPTAPRDSFLLANADYVAAATHDPTVSTYLVDTGGASPPAVAAALRTVAGPGWQVHDISTARRVVGSSLTAVDLGGITRVELGFAFAFMIAATGLLITLGFAERRRTFALAAALGARPRQLAAFLWSEAGFILLAGVTCGAVGGWFLAQMLVTVLTGVFDPPPAAVAIPWGYLGGLLAASVAAVVAVVATSARMLSAAPMTVIREL
jgi:putative ABC transport system permease protein